jgi:O-antigen ligase
LAASIVTLLGGIALILSNPIAAAEITPDQAASATGARSQLWATTGQAIKDSFPFGTGLGSVQSVYHRYEKPDQVTKSYVNHAHNDYLELALELGLGGILLMVGFLTWWGIVATRIWVSSYGSPFGRAATIATAAILVHSFVDFPLRTGAISAIFGACIGLMTLHLAPAAASQLGDTRQMRHFKIG